MTLYIACEASKLWRRILMETFVELNLLAEKWKYILLGLIFQYLHGLAARGVHYLHQPGPTLQDVGFIFLPELGQNKAYISETLFTFIFLSFFLNQLRVIEQCGWHNGNWLKLQYFYSIGALPSYELAAFSHFTEDCMVLNGLENAHREVLDSFNGFNFCATGKSVILSELLLEFARSFWSFYPFVFHSKRFYTVLLWCRVLAFLVVCQILRIITFMATQLPGPNYHCREGSKLARLPRPDSVMEVLLINFPRGVIYGCGDLIFSSHMIFTLVFVLTYQKYGTKRIIKQLAWLVAVIQSLLIIASRKHYTVDIVVAWYTVNLVVYFVDRQLPEELTDRMGGNSSSLLPINGKDKDSKSKEELHMLLNGNTGDSIDWRQRPQINGKYMEDGTPVHTEMAMNGGV